jgi:hypothetical protein
MATFGLGVRYELFQTVQHGLTLGSNDLESLLPMATTVLYTAPSDRISEVFIKNIATTNLTGYSYSFHVYTKRMDTSAYIDAETLFSVTGSGFSIPGYYVSVPTIAAANRGYALTVDSNVGSGANSLKGSFLLYPDERLVAIVTGPTTRCYWSATIREYIS